MIQIFHLMFYAHQHRSSAVINQQGHSVLPQHPKTLPLKSNSQIPQESPASVALQSSMPKAIPSTTPRKPKVHAQLDSPSIKCIQSTKSFNSDSIQKLSSITEPQVPLFLLWRAHPSLLQCPLPPLTPQSLIFNNSKSHDIGLRCCSSMSDAFIFTQRLPQTTRKDDNQ